MTLRVLVLFAVVAKLAAAQAVDIDKLPPMAYQGNADVELKGRELQAIEVAFQQFRHDQRANDVKNFTVELRRRSGKLLISFFPKSDEASHHIKPAWNKYGTYITYFVSLHSLKVVGYTYEAD